MPYRQRLSKSAHAEPHSHRRGGVTPRNNGESTQLESDIKTNSGSMAPEGNDGAVLDELEDMIIDWELDEEAVTPSSFEPIFNRIRSASFTGALIIGFLEGIPFGPKMKTVQEAINIDGNTFSVKL